VEGAANLAVFALAVEAVGDLLGIRISLDDRIHASVEKLNVM